MIHYDQSKTEAEEKAPSLDYADTVCIGSFQKDTII